MILLRLISFLVFLLIMGCSAKQEVIYKTEYKEVYVPVRVQLDKPKKPKYTTKDTIHTYLIKLTKYVKSLEVIIDENNRISYGNDTDQPN